MVTFCSEDRPVTHHHRTFHSLNHPCKRPVTRAGNTPGSQPMMRVALRFFVFFFCSLYSSFTDINNGITKQRKVTHMRQEKCRRGIRQANINAERVVKWQQLRSERLFGSKTHRATNSTVYFYHFVRHVLKHRGHSFSIIFIMRNNAKNSVFLCNYFPHCKR